MVKLAENRYGKSRVRLVRVKRHTDRHDLHEWTVQILLHGDFQSCFTDGDNSSILPTDTMKNTVYSLARNSAADCIEDFAKQLVAFLLNGNPQVSAAEAVISESAWDHLAIGSKPDPTTFVQSSRELRTTTVTQARGAVAQVVSGLKDLVILKTAGSAFTGYIKDALTTLPETRDRLFGTAVGANWTYYSENSAFAQLRCKIRDLLLAAFAKHQSESVQHTLYAMAQNVLDHAAEVKDIQLTMPNKHCLLVDLSRFGQDNPNEIFVPIDEPHGYIEARVKRE
ncbi:MAG TPA: urate oxidase [Candidatus Acidoferrum sp.]|nr:urate oxidase [Candidatus Acidoferrum sp.]